MLWADFNMKVCPLNSHYLNAQHMVLVHFIPGNHCNSLVEESCNPLAFTTKYLKCELNISSLIVQNPNASIFFSSQIV